jgi:fructokinase
VADVSRQRPADFSERRDVLAGGVEGGGTKFVCAVGTGPHDLERAEFRTGDEPARVLSEAVGWLKARERERGPLAAVGVGSFGPVDLRAGSETYGRVTSTPKPGWRGADVAGAFRRAFPLAAVGFETDVNAAALGEFYWGRGRGLSDFVYITMGTGIGAGIVSGGRLVHGLVHPEVGHMLLPRLPGDEFAGACPYHGACWEGLCSGPAVLRRTGSPAESLPADHAAWAALTDYTARALANLVFVLSPGRIIVGGSVRKAGRLGQEEFFRLVRLKTREALAGYISSPALGEGGIEDYVVPPGLGDDAGVCGAIALAQLAAAAG